jgi:hypothetical protein
MEATAIYIKMVLKDGIGVPGEGAAFDIPRHSRYSLDCITSGPASAGLGNLGRTPKVPSRSRARMRSPLVTIKCPERKARLVMHASRAFSVCAALQAHNRSPEKEKRE